MRQRSGQDGVDVELTRQQQPHAGGLAHAAGYQPGRQAGKIRQPIHYAVADRDLFISSATIREAASLAAQAELGHYDCGHFDVYAEAWRSRIVGDEAAFLLRHLQA